MCACVRARVCVRVHANVYVCVSVSARVCECVCACVCVRACECAHACVCVSVYMRVCVGGGGASQPARGTVCASARERVRDDRSASFIVNYIAVNSWQGGSHMKANSDQQGMPYISRNCQEPFLWLEKSTKATQLYYPCVLQTEVISATKKII